ncbi:MAG: ABC transporter substrate-binding protein [Chloroflexi bacterium]|nr:ABC transporter substrate-binding protein [Chloroflexota bacterium]
MSYRFHGTMSLIMLMSLLAVVLAACGGGGTGASPAASGAASPAASDVASPAASGAAASPAASGAASGEAGACPAAAQGAQITMWSPLTGPDGDEMTALANQYSQENGNGIKVQHVPQPEYIQKLNTAAAGNNLPDMTVIRITDVPEMAARNIVRPITEETLGIMGVSGDDFPEAVWNGGEYKDARYSIPLDVNPQVLYYNKDLFQQAGITVPTDRPMNRQEFEAAAEKLNANGVAGIAIGTLYSGETFFDMLIRQFGGGLTNDEGTEAVYNSEAGVQALTYLRDMKQKYSPNIQGQGDPEVTQFQQGKAAMVIHGPWHISNLVKLPFTGFAMVPQIGDEYVAVGGSHQLSLTTQDPAKTAAAACWINWLSTNSVQWAKAGQVPARNSAREDAQLATIAAPVAAFAKEAESVQYPPVVPGISTATGSEGIGRVVNPVLLGQQADIKAGLDAAVQRSNQLIQQNAQQYGGQ